MKQAAVSAYVQVVSMYKEHADSAKKLKATGDLMRCLLSLFCID